MDQEAKSSGSSCRKSNIHVCNLHLKLWKSFPAGRLDQTGRRSDGAPGRSGATLTLSIPASPSPWPDLWSFSPAVLTPGCFKPSPRRQLRAAFGPWHWPPQRAVCWGCCFPSPFGDSSVLCTSFKPFSIATVATWLACLLYEIWKFLRA